MPLSMQILCLSYNGSDFSVILSRLVILIDLASKSRFDQSWSMYCPLFGCSQAQASSSSAPHRLWMSWMFCWWACQAPALTVSQIESKSKSLLRLRSLYLATSCHLDSTSLHSALQHANSLVHSNSDGNVQALLVSAQHVWQCDHGSLRMSQYAFGPLINICSTTFFWLAASSLKVYRVMNVSRAALHIQITLFLAYTFPYFPLTLRFR